MPDSSLSNVNDYTRNFSIDIVHVPSGRKVSFGAFINSFNDSYKTNIKTQTVYGRMDPIVNYQNTTRTITLSFTVPASSEEDAQDNLIKISSLIKFQYPSYSNAEVTSGIATPPICKLKFENLINESGDYLFGYFTGVDFSPINESGYFINDNGYLFPKEYKINLNFTVLHTVALGWTKKGFAASSYPYLVTGDFAQTADAGGGTDANNLDPTDNMDQANVDDITGVV